MPQQKQLNLGNDPERDRHAETVGTFEDLLKLDPSEVGKIEVGLPQSAEAEPSTTRVTIPPEEDARLAPLESYIGRQWQKFMPKYYQLLQQNGKLEESVHQMGLMCILVLNQFQDAGLGADQGREAIQPLIVPEPE